MHIMITPKVGLTGQYVNGAAVQWAGVCGVDTVNNTVDCNTMVASASPVLKSHVAVPFVDVGGVPPAGAYFQAIDPTA
jgi:hypothetical protein